MTADAIEPVARIDLDDDGVDDVAIAPVQMFRLERMDKHLFWACTYDLDGRGRHNFWIRAKKGRITVTHEWQALS